MKLNKLFALLVATAFVMIMLAGCVATPTTQNTTTTTTTTAHTHQTYMYEESGEGHVGFCACGENTAVLEHTYGADDTCTACGAEKPEPPHEHSYTYSESGAGHIGSCTCGENTAVLEHTYGADDKCTACGADKPAVTPPVVGGDDDFSNRY